MCLWGCNSNPSSNPPPPSAPDTGACKPGDLVSGCKVTVSVVINLSQPVACPGHPLSMTAVGAPSGGTYAWTVAGAGLVDGSGNPVSSGDTVFLRGFKTDDATGAILEQSTTVSVTYTHPAGTANDSKPVKIHKIDFDVTDTTITASLTQVDETGPSLFLGRISGAADTMDTKPSVKIKLDPSCPRKTACAQNHRVGWLQTVVSNDRRNRYTDTLMTISVTLPVRDGNPASGADKIPYYDDVVDFTGDGDTEAAHHRDGPGNGAQWTDPRPGAPAPPPPKNRQLRQVFFQSGFTAWLAVQNKEWGAHDLAGSFAYQKNFDWSVHLDLTVDMTKPAGSQCTPKSAPPTIGAMANGKGSVTPVLTATVANNAVTVTVVAAPTI